MKRTFSLVIALGLFVILANLLTAQGWMRTWGGPSGDGADWVEVTSDSGFIIAGGSLTPNKMIGYTEYGCLTKFNSAGGMMWMRAYPMDGLVSKSEFNCVQVTPDRGYVAVGSRTVWPEEGPTQDLLILRTDAIGDTLWTRTYGIDGIDEGHCIRLTPDSGFVIAGQKETVSDGLRFRYLWVLRTDSLADTLWTVTLGQDSVLNWAQCVSLTSDGGYIVTGGNGTEESTWVVKLNDDGDVLWQRTYDLVSVNVGVYVEETSDGGFIVTGGSTVTPQGTSDLYILKLDENGDSLWVKKYQEPGMNWGTCVHQTPDGGYIVAGIKSYMGSFDPTSQGWLLRTDSNGDTLWTRTITWDDDGSNEFDCLQFTPDGGYIISGEAGDYETEKGYEFWLVKTDSLGYVPIEEDQIEVESNIDTSAPLGKPVEIRYTDMPGGFHAYVFDATGRKVSEIHNPATSGTISWGEGYGPGVYFIREISSGASHKVVLVK